MTRGKRRRRTGSRYGSSERLIGWLISYANNDKGQSIELRAGRYLISGRDAGEKRTITLQDSTIAVPHLALNASPRQGLLCLDIFSGSGSFITKGGNERPISGPTPLEHGDWLRIGENVRFQVCLIDDGGR